MRGYSSGNPGRRQTCCPLSLRRRRATMTCFISSVIARCWTRALPRACTKTTAATSRTTPLPTVFPTALLRRFFAAKPRPACAPWPATERMRGAGLTGSRFSRSSAGTSTPSTSRRSCRPVDLRMLRVCLCADTRAQLPAPVAGHAAWRQRRRDRRAGSCRSPRRSFARCRHVSRADRRALPPGLLLLPVPADRRRLPRARRGDARDAFAGLLEDRGFRRPGRGGRHLAVGRARLFTADPRSSSPPRSSVAGIDLVVETSGVGWEPGVLRPPARARARAPMDRLAGRLHAPTYAPLRGEGFDEALADGREPARAVPRHAPGCRRCG